MSMLLHPRFTSLYTSIKSTMIKILCRRVLPAIRINSAIARGADLWNGPQQAENLGPQIPARCPPRNFHWPDNNAICEVKLWSFRHGNFGGFPSRRSGSRHLCHGIPERKTKSEPGLEPLTRESGTILRYKFCGLRQIGFQIMRSLKNILLIGSTGTIGSAVRKALVARKSAFDKVGVLTGAASLADPKKAEAFQSVKSEGVEIVVAELDDKSGLVKALKGNQFDIPLIDD